MYNAKRINVKAIICSIAMVLMLLSAVVGTISYYVNEKSYTVTITDKERITEKSGDEIKSKYLVFCKEDNGATIVFENTDVVFKGKWNSSDIQGRLEIGKKYRIKTIGYRIPFFSMYENIISVSPVN